MKPQTQTACLILISAALISGAGLNAAAPNWPQFRGPHGDGNALDANLPLHWNETNHVAWKISIPGRGRSSPVVSGERIWLTTAIEKGVVRKRIGPDDMQTAEHVVLHALSVDGGTGSVIWDTTLFDVPNPEPVHWLNSWSTPTPVIEGDRLYCEFGTFGTACLDSKTGKVVWQRRIACDHQVGPGSSPVIWKDRLILVRDGREAQFVTALDKTTGKTIWKTDRPLIEAPNPNLKKSFSTPLLAEHDGKTEIIAPGPHWTAAYDPASGKELWRLRHGKGFSIGTSPVVGNGLAFFGTGCFKAELWAVRLGGQSDVTQSHFAWKTLKQVPVMSSPLLLGDELYWVSDDGMVTCADAKTGNVHWQDRLGGPCLASPIAARGRVYFFRQDGKSVVFKSGTQMERLAENVLSGTVIASPSVAGDSLIVRTDTHLYRVTN